MYYYWKYIVYDDFVNNYQKDFSSWKKIYVSGEESDYLKCLVEEYKKDYDFFLDISESKFLNEIILFLPNKLEEIDSDFSVSYMEFEEILSTRLRKYLKESNNVLEDNGFMDAPLNFFYILPELLKNQNFLDSHFLDKVIYKYEKFIDFDMVDNVFHIRFNFGEYENYYYTIKRIFEFIDNKIKPSQFENDFDNEQKSKLVHKELNKLKWQGTNLELTELIKSLILTNKLNSELTEKEIFIRFRDFLDVKDFSQTDKAKDIRKRTKDLTPFLNTLEIGLTNWIKSKD